MANFISWTQGGVTSAICVEHIVSFEETTKGGYVNIVMSTGDEMQTSLSLKDINTLLSESGSKVIVKF